jgi:hypothetical protein
MFELSCSPKLNELLEELDDSWEALQIDRLPFPLAYTLERLRQEDYAWDFLLKDMLHVLLKYVAIIAVADYLHASEKPDFNVNDELRQIALNMSEGHWLKIIRACATRPGVSVVPEVSEIFGNIEQRPYTARLMLPRISLKTGRQGILSTLIIASAVPTNIS